MDNKAKDIGIDVKAPEEPCTDQHCPFHGKLSVRGQVIEGVVVSEKMKNTAVVERDYLTYDSKYERFVKKTSRYSAHCPPCLGVKTGDSVKAVECRPLSKTVSFVIVEKR
jgi:small subunit ribosomal protein S17